MKQGLQALLVVATVLVSGVATAQVVNGQPLDVGSWAGLAAVLSMHAHTWAQTRRLEKHAAEEVARHERERHV